MDRRQADRLGNVDDAQRWLLHAAESGDAESMLMLAKRSFYARQSDEF